MKRLIGILIIVASCMIFFGSCMSKSYLEEDLNNSYTYSSSSVKKSKNKSQICVYLMLVSAVTFILGRYIYKHGKTEKKKNLYLLSPDHEIFDKNNEKSNLKKLNELAQMRYESLITEEDFQAKKKDILDNM